MDKQSIEALEMTINLLESLKTGAENFTQSNIHIACEACEEALARELLGYVSVPKDADEAEAMEKLGYAWLQQNAPERLKQSFEEPVASVMDCDVRGNPIIIPLKNLPIGTKLYTR